LEIRFFPRRKDSFVRQYFSLGTALNFLIASNDDISFTNAEMKKYSSEVTKNLEKPNFFNGYVYAGVGLKIGKTNHPFGQIEMHFPTLIFGKNINAFTKAGTVAAGMGFQVTLQIPVSSKEQKANKILNN
jgi:hypothetical protein